MQNHRFQWPVRPLAASENLACGRTCRISVLTPSLLRLEYAPDGVFEDRASQSMFYRDFPSCDFAISREGDTMVVETATVRLSCEDGVPFSRDTLSCALKSEPGTVWHYGDEIETLGGTVRTLDCVDGAMPLGDGVCSRRGIAVLDDSRTMLLGEDGWVEVRPEGRTDLYLFAYGYDYRTAVRDLMRLTGAPPLLPAYALGNWWSRYHAYSADEYLALMERFENEGIPFSVGVVDMDWHVTEIPEELRETEERVSDGWTGYSWNRELFPDYKAFLNTLKEKDLKIALNLHPHAGVRRHEDMYPQMATACGIDPASGKRIPFDILSQTYMANYFDVLHHPYEEDGVDFWWMDWQQGTDYFWIHEPNKDGKLHDEREVLDPLWMLNHLHILDISRNGKRPMFFSRFSGPGSQRYPVGFSGDTVMSWDSLRFQPYFTATASNIGYPWWSHDIGGHMRGFRDDELTTRWMQLGVFSPINRLHSANSLFNRKEPWCYGSEAKPIMARWLRMRHNFFPYLYAMNYRAHRELLPLVQPMYYSHPLCDKAYEVKNQFWFGSELMVAAATAKRHPVSRLTATEVWIPEGDWFDFETGLHYRASSPRGRMIETHRGLDRYPVFAKAGAIVPMADYADNRLQNADTLDLYVFPGADNTFTLFEDGGDGYEGEVSTTMTLSYADTCAVFTVAPAEGELSLIPQTRRLRIHLRGFAQAITVEADGASVSYDADTNTTTVDITAAVSETVTVTVTGDALMHDNRDLPVHIERILQDAQMPILMKMDWYDMCVDPTRSAHENVIDLGASTDGYAEVRNAIRELLTLTKGEFEK
ncbi:MAG: DUF5110 domain-containing protein [Clostridia bacterium]|nr:DUF5110 domain-containing protein [Clostridia bacterium]